MFFTCQAAQVENRNAYCVTIARPQLGEQVPIGRGLSGWRGLDEMLEQASAVGARKERYLLQKHLSAFIRPILAHPRSLLPS